MKMNRTTPDLTGKKFGRLVVKSRPRENPNIKRGMWCCVCECGATKNIRGDHLLSGATVSCGCIRVANLKGERFGRLTVLEKNGTNNQNSMRWLCRCDCGTNVTVISGN